MQTYHVVRDFPQNGHIHRKGHTIELSERQARYLLINGFVEKAEMAAPDSSDSKVASNPKEKKAAVKKKSVKKRAAKKSK